MSIKAVIFSLEGGGDHDRFLASPQALEWCNQAWSAVKQGAYPLPDEVLSSLAPFQYTDTKRKQWHAQALEEECLVTQGSADNDAALYLSSLCRSFDSIREMMAFIAENDIEVVSEYEGCIY